MSNYVHHNIIPNTVRFPLNDFEHYFTLFSKFFSPFPRGTCLLSVSYLYLALGVIYLLKIKVAISNNPTQWTMNTYFV